MMRKTYFNTSESTKEKRMGLAYNTRVFQISRKKTLNDAHRIFYAPDQSETKSIRAWIEKDPIRLWHEVYSRPSKLSLCIDSYRALTNVIKIIDPQLFKEKEIRKNNYRK
jgi:hypothetical protein